MNSAMSPKNGQDIEEPCVSIAELEDRAKENMDKNTEEYFNAGAESGITTRENKEAYQQYKIQSRVLCNVSNIVTQAQIFGTTCRIPVGSAPTGLQGLAHREGERAMAKACAAAGSALVLSAISTTSLEEVADVSDNAPKAMQAYIFRERHHTRQLIARAKSAGYMAVFVTVDSPYIGRRYHALKTGISLPSHLSLPNFASQDHARKGNHGNSLDPNWLVSNPNLTWEHDIQWLKEQCHPELQIWLKGITSPQDAVLAAQCGVDGIVVSNHGGRQLDGTVTTIDALPRVVAAVAGRIPVHVDGGIRQGSDIFKALALGASFVWVGRPILWGLAYRGEEGVKLCLRLLEEELRVCMAFAGISDIRDITPECIVSMNRHGGSLPHALHPPLTGKKWNARL